MKNLLALALPALLLACASAPPVKNDRPPQPFSPASSLVEQCQVTVRFNEDERSVKEAEYLDSFFCLGVVQGILGVNTYTNSSVFCLPRPGIKTWIAAKVVVEYAKKHPEKLTMQENDFAIEALIEAFPCKSAAASPIA